jgi:hypothetical protein
VYLGRSKTSTVIDKSLFNIEASIIKSVGWMHHDTIDFFYDNEIKCVRLMRNPKQGHLLQIRQREGAAARLVLPKDLLQKTLLEWFPVLRATDCKIKTIACEIAKQEDNSLIVSNFALVD